MRQRSAHPVPRDNPRCPVHAESGSPIRMRSASSWSYRGTIVIVRSDALLAHSHAGPFVGDDVYEVDGATQSIEEVVEPGERVYEVVRLQNDGDGLIAAASEASSDISDAVRPRFRVRRPIL
jgi:hypothetical protein